MDILNLPKTRADAKASGATHYFTGEPCKHGHIALRKTKGTCIECLKVEWRQATETRAEYFRAYNKLEAVKDRKNAWYQDNRDQVIAAAKTTPLDKKAQYKRDWKERNTVWVRADTKARRRKHRKAVPPWATNKHKAEIRQLYQIAITMTRTTGEQYVVDHIYPLRSDVVCGLHIPWNLRVITQQENSRKSNSLPPDSEALAFPPNP